MLQYEQQAVTQPNDLRPKTSPVLIISQADEGAAVTGVSTHGPRHCGTDTSVGSHMNIKCCIEALDVPSPCDPLPSACNLE